jgi:hypothetical protein
VSCYQNQVYSEGMSRLWTLWPQYKHGANGAFAALGFLIVLILMGLSIARSPESIQGSGRPFFSTDVALLLGYAAFLFLVWGRAHSESEELLSTGTRFGLILGSVLVTSHAIEFFMPSESRAVQLIRGAGSVLLMLGLLGAVGSAVWQRTRSAGLAVIAGLWSASLAVLILLGFALTLNLVFEARATSWLYQPFVASGMKDSRAFVVRNSLEAASEILIRLPISAVALSLIGAVLNAWIATRSKPFTVLIACATPFVFAAGVFSLWHADSLVRAARPPFVLAGVLGAGVALCSIHPVWSAIHRHRNGA